MCTMVLATVIHQTKWSFTVLSNLFCSSRHCPMILDYSIKDEISSYLFLNEIYCCTRQGISKQNLVSVFHLIHNQLFHPLSKSLKNIVFVFFFWMQFLLSDRVIKNKRDLELVTLQVTKQVWKNDFISYKLSDQIWWYNIKWFLSYSKNCICKFKPANSWHKLFHFYLFFHLSFWIWKIWKGNNYKNLNISRMRAF